MHPSGPDLISELRELIVRAAPDPEQAEPVRRCGTDDLLDEAIPFSSVIVLGTIVAIEHRFGIRVTRRQLTHAFDGGVTLAKLAGMVEKLTDEQRRANGAHTRHGAPEAREQQDVFDRDQSL